MDSDHVHMTGRPAAPRVPPVPAYAPGAPGDGFLAWLRAPRAAGVGLGIWQLGHRPRPEQEPEQVPGRQLIVGALVAALVAWVAWSLMYGGYLGLWWLLPLELVVPDAWLHGQAGTGVTLTTYYGYYAVIAVGLLVAAGRAGRWGEVWRRYVAPRLTVPAPAPTAPLSPDDDPAGWPQLRATGATAAADRLASDARAGLLRDVDHARILRAWASVQAGRLDPAAFTNAVAEQGAEAFVNASGARDLPTRRARHDLMTHQVKVGTVSDAPKNAYAYRTAGVGISPDMLGTSLVAVGPGAGTVLRPIAEALRLQALAARAAVVVVGAAEAEPGPAEQYDVVIRLADPEPGRTLDLYGGATDPDEAAAVLAEALMGDLANDESEGHRRAASVLAALLRPYEAVHGRFPSVGELRQLLDGSPARIGELRRALAGNPMLLRELDARERQLGAPGDASAPLADRIALLDRPALARHFDTTGGRRPFSLRALNHPVRVRVELPGRHTDASRIVARLLLAQFVTCASARRDRELFACLVLDDASGAVTAEAVRGMQRLRSANAGILLGLPTLDEVAPALRGPLLGAAGCRVALSGLTPWDGQHFAEVWGTQWTETTDITDRQIIAESAGGRALHILRQAITGRAPTARAVTVRQVERARWSASELTHEVPVGHAVMSLSSVSGERTAPLLVNLRD